MNASTTHPVSSEELMAHLDGELAAERDAAVFAHIAGCPECSEQAASLREVSGVLHRWETGPLGAAAEGRILAAQSQALPSRQAGLVRVLGRFRRWTWERWTLLGVVSGTALLLLTVAGSNRRVRPYMAAYEASSLDREKALAEENLALAHKLEQRVQEGDLADNLEKTASTAAPPPPAPPPPSWRVTIQQEEEATPMIARTAELRIVVPKLESARGSLDAVLQRYRAYAATLQVNTTEGSPREITASLRVPAQSLSPAMADLKALGRVESESQSGEEVTEQHSDLVARLKNSRETELRLQDILRTRTGKVKDVLEVETEISRVRGEIEQMEAERKNLEHRVDFATLSLTLAEEFKAQLSSPAPSLGTRWRNSVVTGFRNAFDGLFSLILFVSAVAPVLLLWLALLAPVGWLVWRRVRAMRTALS